MRGDLIDDGQHARVVHRIALHGGKQAHTAQAERPQAAGHARRGIVGERVEHEEADEAVGRQSDGGGDGVLVAGDAGDERGAMHLLTIEFGDPSAGKRLGRSGRLPLQRRANRVDGVGGEPAVRVVARQRLEETRREEVAVGVVGHAVGNSRSRRQPPRSPGITSAPPRWSSATLRAAANSAAAW